MTNLARSNARTPCRPQSCKTGWYASAYRLIHQNRPWFLGKLDHKGHKGKNVVKAKTDSLH